MHTTEEDIAGRTADFSNPSLGIVAGIRRYCSPVQPSRQTSKQSMKTTLLGYRLLAMHDVETFLYSQGNETTD